MARPDRSLTYNQIFTVEDGFSSSLCAAILGRQIQIYCRLTPRHCTSLECSEIIPMSGQGSTGNVIAAVCSFFIPGLGQLVQGRLMMAIIQFILAAVLWFILLGWLIHLWSILDAALYKGPG